MIAPLLAAALLTGIDADPPGTEVVVVVNRHRFEPASVEVRLGTRVIFHNSDVGDVSWTVVASDGSFESRPLAPGGEWSHRFVERGEHEYFVREHPETKGRALVR